MTKKEAKDLTTMNTHYIIDEVEKIKSDKDFIEVFDKLRTKLSSDVIHRMAENWNDKVAVELIMNLFYCGTLFGLHSKNKMDKIDALKKIIDDKNIMH